MNTNRIFKIKVVGQAIIIGLIVAYFIFSMINSEIQYNSLKKQYLTEFSEVTRNLGNKDMPNFHTVNDISRKEDIEKTLIKLNICSELNKDKINSMRGLLSEINKYENRRNRNDLNKISESFASIITIRDLAEKYDKNGSKSDTEIKEDCMKLINAYKNIYQYREVSVLEK